MSVSNEKELIDLVRETLSVCDGMNGTSARMSLSIGPAKDRHFTVFDPDSGETYIVSVHNLVERKNKD